MKTVLTLILFFLQSISLVCAQGGTWVWMKGSSTYNSTGSYGTQGVPSISNNPRAIYEAAQWTDLNGNFWIFGGGYGGQPVYSDLWKYDVTTNIWTWMRGPGTPDEYASYGVKGVSSPTNHPGARGLAAATWTDSNNNLWLFGGNGKAGVSSYLTGDLNDLWKYDISTNEWTWMHGDTVTNTFGVYGVQGISSPLNKPGARHETNCTWVDDNGNLWLFGGYTMDPSNFNAGGDDLWKYDLITNEWTWIKGSSTVGASAVYGTKGLSSPNNTPGGRCTYARWKDAAGNFWLFGGWNTISGYTYNDFWKYDLSTNEWMWTNGSSAQYSAGNYSSLCNNNVNDIPSARYENRAAWTDHCGNFWLYGGCSQNIINSVLGDLWMYNPTTDIWKWVFGNTVLNRPTVFGTQGVPSSTNDPGSRMGAVSFIDLAGNLWLFGGDEVYGGGNTHNDLWKFIADTNCVNANCGGAAPIVNLSSSDTTWCDKKAIDFFDLSANNPTSWQWYFPGANPDTSTLQNPTGIYYATSGTFPVSLVACNSVGCDSITYSTFINEFPTPVQPLVIDNGDTLCASTSVTYQWFEVSNPTIVLSTAQCFIPAIAGNYFVIVTDANGCESASQTVSITTGVHEIRMEEYVSVNPNPFNSLINVELNLTSSKSVSISMSDMLGREIKFIPTAYYYPGKNKISVDLSNLTNGMYFMKIKLNEDLRTVKLIKD